MAKFKEVYHPAKHNWREAIEATPAGSGKAAASTSPGSLDQGTHQCDHPFYRLEAGWHCRLLGGERGEWLLDPRRSDQLANDSTCFVKWMAPRCRPDGPALSRPMNVAESMRKAGFQERSNHPQPCWGINLWGNSRILAGTTRASPIGRTDKANDRFQSRLPGRPAARTKTKVAETRQRPSYWALLLQSRDFGRGRCLTTPGSNHVRPYEPTDQS